LFDHFSLSYDIIVNFIEGHDQATKMIQQVIQNKNFVNKILLESQKNIQGAEKYMHSNIEDTFPEICKAIQHRRAEYYLLVHEYHYIDKMLKNGQIEDKEAVQLKAEIDQKIYFLQMNSPEIIMVDQNTRIVHYSELSEVFTRDELHTAF